MEWRIARWIKRQKTGIIVMIRFFDDVKQCFAGGLDDARERREHPLANDHRGSDEGHPRVHRRDTAQHHQKRETIRCPQSFVV